MLHFSIQNRTKVSILYCKMQHFALDLFPKMLPNAAPVSKSHILTSPNIAPATQYASHDSSAFHINVIYNT